MSNRNYPIVLLTAKTERLDLLSDLTLIRRFTASNIGALGWKYCNVRRSFWTASPGVRRKSTKVLCIFWCHAVGPLLWSPITSGLRLVYVWSKDVKIYNRIVMCSRALIRALLNQANVYSRSILESLNTDARTNKFSIIQVIFLSTDKQIDILQKLCNDASWSLKAGQIVI